MQFADRLHTWPVFIAAGERGEGFAELTTVLRQFR
jgi:hypothetical protein